MTKYLTMENNKKMNYFNKNGFFIVTLILFLISLGLHLVWGWLSFVADELEKGSSPEHKKFLIQWGRDVMENWQSELLQTAYTVVALKYLKFVGSPQSKEGMDRTEKKIDMLLRLQTPSADDIIKELDNKYPKN